jgi:MtN3 and saliva related transmembrane protein
MTFVSIMGFSAAVLTTAAFIPQALKTITTKNTKDLSLPMYLILTTGILFWLIYGILIIDYPIILANVVTLVFALIILVNKIRYK